MKLLQTGASLFHLRDLQYLAEIGFDTVHHENEKEAVACPAEYDAVICNGLFMYQDISKFSRLKFIQLISAGFDRIPIDYIKNHAIDLYNAGDTYSIPIAEHVVSGILQVLRYARFFYRMQTLHSWEKRRDLQTIQNRKICVIGAGSIGRAVAKRLAAFDVHLTGIRRQAVQTPFFDRIITLKHLDEVLNESDIVVLALPLTEETQGLFDSGRFAKMKPGSIFVNVSRGKLVDENALVDALKTERLFGAVLDVFENEPLPESSLLWDMENVMITPHCAFVGEHNQQKLRKLALNHLKKFADAQKIGT